MNENEPRPDLVLINKKIWNCKLVIFAISGDRRTKINQIQKKQLGSCQRAEKAAEHESDGDTNCSRYSWNGPLKAWKRRCGK